jgi:hypothetical protein
VRLQAGGEVRTAPLEIRMDPRVKVSSADLERLFRMESRLASLITATQEVIDQVRPLGEDLEKLAPRVPASLASTLAALREKVASLMGKPGGYFDPVSPEPTLRRLAGDTGSLYGQVGGVDAAPTRSQKEALTGLDRDSGSLMSRWNGIRTADLPALNRRLVEANLPEIKLRPQALPVSESEDLE